MCCGLVIASVYVVCLPWSVSAASACRRLVSVRWVSRPRCGFQLRFAQCASSRACSCAASVHLRSTACRRPLLLEAVGWAGGSGVSGGALGDSRASMSCPSMGLVMCGAVCPMVCSADGLCRSGVADRRGSLLVFQVELAASVVSAHFRSTACRRTLLFGVVGLAGGSGV